MLDVISFISAFSFMFLSFKALNIRQAHERPEAMEETSVVMVGLKKERILQGLEISVTNQLEVV